MSRLRSALRRKPVTSDEDIRRYVATIRADLEPDPLFRRRLRGRVVNRFVAARESPGRPARGSAPMGKLGRACLYASVALVMSVGGVMAASRGAVPGDLLYPVKLDIEGLRMRALPAHFRDDLAVYALSERISELGLLAEAGDWEAVSGMAASIDAAYAQVERVGLADPRHDGALARRIEVLEALVERLPAQAQSSIERALQRSAAVNRTGRSAGHGAAGPDSHPGPGEGPDRASGVGVSDDGTDREAPPARAARPTPKATSAAGPSSMPKGSDAAGSDE